MNKRIIMLLLSVCMLLGLLAGCAPEQGTSGGDSAGAVSTKAPTSTATPELTPEPTPEPYDGYLYLTVSRIDFSLQGESEDIYCGTIPRETVAWESADESVATVENGVLTATGVGSTTVACEYNGERIECTVGCLAATEEDLNKLDEKTLRSPKRVPPIVSDDPITFFEDAAIIGDSITYIMWQWETKYNYLGDVTFLVRGGTSLNGFVNNYKNIYYKGVETKLENAIASTGVKKVFLMMGQNDLSYRAIDETMESWEVLTKRILEKSPDVEIYIESLIPEWTKSTAKNSANEKIFEYNILLEQFCKEKGFHFVDVAPYAVDHTGRMPTTYSLDQSIHMNEEGCYQWMQLLKSYAFLQENEGDNT